LQSGGIDAYRLQHRPHEAYDAKRGAFVPAGPPDPAVAVPSFWFDLLLERESEQRVQQGLSNPAVAGRDPGVPSDPALDHQLAAARERLATVRKYDRYELDRRAQRDLTSSGFVPAAGSPMFIAEMFATAARARAALAAALPQQPLPPTGDHVEVPRLATGAAVAVVASEGAVVQETDPTSALATSNKAMISGQVDVSRQLLAFSRPGIEQVLAADLGAATGLLLDQQLVAGTNSAGQTMGLASVVGINTVSYTAATPSAAAFASKVWAAYEAIVSAGGGPADPSAYLTVMAPRRLAWYQAFGGASSATPVQPGLPGQVIAVPGVRANLGASTSEDEVFVLARDELPIALGRPMFQVFEDVLSATQTVRLAARQYAATLFPRSPKSIARISGSGLVAPTL
jgi:hypothetical protein